jgi:hypothetical protein
MVSLDYLDNYDAANRRFAESIEVTPSLVHKIAQVIRVRFPDIESNDCFHK